MIGVAFGQAELRGSCALEALFFDSESSDPRVSSRHTRTCLFRLRNRRRTDDEPSPKRRREPAQNRILVKKTRKRRPNLSFFLNGEMLEHGQVNRIRGEVYPAISVAQGTARRVRISPKKAGPCLRGLPFARAPASRARARLSSLCARRRETPLRVRRGQLRARATAHALCAARHAEHHLSESKARASRAVARSPQLRPLALRLSTAREPPQHPTTANETRGAHSRPGLAVVFYRCLTNKAMLVLRDELNFALSSQLFLT